MSAVHRDGWTKYLYKSLYVFLAVFAATIGISSRALSGIGADDSRPQGSRLSAEMVALGEIGSGRTIFLGSQSSMSGARTLYWTNGGTVVRNWSAGSELDIREKLSKQAWSPVDDAMMVGWIWEENRNALYVLTMGGSRRKVLMLPRRMHAGQPTWSFDGKTIFVCVMLDLPWYKSDPRDDNPPNQNVNVSVSGTRSPYSYIRYSKKIVDVEYVGAVASARRSLVLAVDLSTGNVGVVARGNDVSAAYPSPDGRWLALVQMKYLPQGHRADIYTVPVPGVHLRSTINLENYNDRRAGWADVENKRVIPVISDIETSDSFVSQSNNSVLWSPDSTRFAFSTIGREATGDVYSYELDTRRTENLTGKFNVPKKNAKGVGYGDHYTASNKSNKFSEVLWLPDGKALVGLARGDAWRVPLKSTGTIVLLTDGIPEETVRIVPAFDRNCATLDSDGRVLAHARNAVSRYDSFYAVDPESLQSDRISDTGMWIAGSSVVINQKSKSLIFVAHNNERDNNIFTLGLRAGAALEQVTRYKMEFADRIFPRCQNLFWTAASGYRASGVLCVPATASIDQKMPMLVEAYRARPVAQVDIWAEQGPRIVNYEIMEYLRSGIALFLPDIPLSDEGVYERPLKQTVEGVQAALAAALSTGLIDSSRIALAGEAFLVDSALSHINQFKVAFVFGSAPNWFGEWNAFMPQMYETGSGRFEVPLWKEPMRYAENSPIAYVDRLKTPVMYFQGGDQQYAALTKLGSTAVNVAGRSRDQDSRQRVMLWLREHFFGDDPAIQKADLPPAFLN